MELKENEMKCCIGCGDFEDGTYWFGITDINGYKGLVCRDCGVQIYDTGISKRHQKILDIKYEYDVMRLINELKIKIDEMDKKINLLNNNL
jgi:hypothetical protein